jgi:hypothetical protein
MSTDHLRTSFLILSIYLLATVHSTFQHTLKTLSAQCQHTLSTPNTLPTHSKHTSNTRHRTPNTLSRHSRRWWCRTCRRCAMTSAPSASKPRRLEFVTVLTTAFGVCDCLNRGVRCVLLSELRQVTVLTATVGANRWWCRTCRRWATTSAPSAATSAACSSTVLTATVDGRAHIRDCLNRNGCHA